MKNVSSLNSNNVESPKTPGGISKALLTPCRRIGLSRNWRKGGPSPFISPISGSAELRQEPDTRKRKQRDKENTRTEENASDDNGAIPSLHVEPPRRKKSKSSALNIEIVQVSETVENVFNESQNNCKVEEDSNENEIAQVVTPVSSKTKSKTLTSSTKTSVANNVDLLINECNVDNIKERKNSFKEAKVKKRSPENLTKECMVVIQKKIFKKDLKKDHNAASNETTNEQKSITSQTLFDSDSDELPLSKLNKNATNIEKVEQLKCAKLDEDDDFIENNKIKIIKPQDKTTSTGSLKKVKVKKQNKELLPQKPTEEIKEYKPSSQSSVDDEDDFDLHQKKTILIRKCYDKVTRPLKAKSTGSLTQKDIDELRSRIEVKKKLLLAKAITEDTQELRDLIKKWQKGCQDALMELMDLMRSKFPDKQNMDYSEMLQMLKIPSALVGYDADNDCFNSPDDTNIVLSKFNV